MLEAARNGTLSEWVTEQMNAHENALENAKIRPPVIPSKGFVPKVTAQEKAALENRRKGLIQAKGAMKPSEKSNGFAMPKTDEAGNWFHRYGAIRISPAAKSAAGDFPLGNAFDAFSLLGEKDT